MHNDRVKCLLYCIFTVRRIYIQARYMTEQNSNSVSVCRLALQDICPVSAMSTGRVDPRVGSGRVRLGRIGWRFV